MGEKLVSIYTCIVGGISFESGPDPAAIGQPISCSAEWRDNEAGRVELKVWDGMGDTGWFPIHNSLPNPRCNTTVPFECWMGWEEETQVKVFEGVLAVNELMYQSGDSVTRLVGSHKALKLRQRARVDNPSQMTVADVLKKKQPKRVWNLSSILQRRLMKALRRLTISFTSSRNIIGNSCFGTFTSWVMSPQQTAQT